MKLDLNEKKLSNTGGVDDRIETPWPIILTFAEAAKLLRISRPTLFELVHRGKVPARQVGKQWRFRRDALLEYLYGKGPIRRSGRNNER